MSGFWYLGSPYGKYTGGLQAAHDDIVAQADRLILAGVKFFCPIAHTHNIAISMAKRGVTIADPHRFWLDLDRPLMEAAKGLIVCKLPGWTESSGLKEEIQYFQEAGKTIVLYVPNGTIWPGLFE